MLGVVWCGVVWCGVVWCGSIAGMPGWGELTALAIVGVHLHRDLHPVVESDVSHKTRNAGEEVGGRKVVTIRVS